MAAPRFERLKEIFHAARELQPAERSAFLEKACGADEPLRREIEALLASDLAADRFIADPPATLAAEVFGGAPIQSEAGRIIGHYKLLEPIGAGGMGTVHLAERADQQFQMQVAIKLIKRGMDTDSVLRRFQHERQILASLEHPNIARLLDGGTTDDGVPYFVMEYIKGERIDRYVEEHRLPIRERLELFRQVCGAVSYAHQHLVVHRDLKPSNILVTPDGVPKLLDFGIAKIIQPNDSAESLPTITAVPIMTPEYASPEQIEGAPATTLSDVYSLGAVLYELLSGCLPFRLQNRSPQEIEKAIGTAIIAKPSAVVTRSEDARHLRGDLDNIALMAMRKETARRYRSVEQFSEDIRRHLTGRPVIARADTMSYRASKFIRRNKVALSAALLIFLTLVGGIIATTWQARRATVQGQKARAEQARAERRFNDVRKLANTVLFDYHDAIKSLPGATKVRERLVNDAMTYLDSLAAEAHDDPALQRELGVAYERVGDVRGGQTSANLGDLAGAVNSYTKALRIREALIALKPDDAQARRELAGSHRDLGLCLVMMTELNSGVEHLKKARTLFFDLTQKDPANEKLQFDLTGYITALGAALIRAGDLSGAVAEYRAAIAIFEALFRSQPHEQKFRFYQLRSELSLTNALWTQQSDVAAAKAANDEAEKLAHALIAADPVNTDYQQALVSVYFLGGEIRKTSERPAALEYFRKAAEVQEKLLKADPANVAAEQGLTDLYIEMAHVLSRQDDNSQALHYYGKSAEHLTKLTTDAANAYLGSRLKAVTARAGAAGMRARLGEIDFPLAECSRLATHIREIPDDPANIHFRSYRAEAYEHLGYAYRDIAAASTAPVSETRQYVNVARDMFRQSMHVFDDIRSRGALSPTDAVEAELVAAEIAKCDAALKE